MNEPDKAKLRQFLGDNWPKFRDGSTPDDFFALKDRLDALKKFESSMLKPFIIYRVNAYYHNLINPK